MADLAPSELWTTMPEVLAVDLVGWGIGIAGVAVGIYGIVHGSRLSSRLEVVLASRLEREPPQEVIRRVRTGPDAAAAALFGQHVDGERLREALRLLPVRERTVFTLRFFDQMTLQEIAQVFGISRERIRQIEGLTIEKLRAVLTNAS